MYGAFCLVTSEHPKLVPKLGAGQELIKNNIAFLHQRYKTVKVEDRMKFLKVAFAILAALSIIYMIALVINPKLDAYLVSIETRDNANSLDEFEGMIDGYILELHFIIVNNNNTTIQGYGVFSRELSKRSVKEINEDDVYPLIIKQGESSVYRIEYLFDNEAEYRKCNLSSFTVYSSRSFTSPEIVEKYPLLKWLFVFIGFGFCDVRNLH